MATRVTESKKKRKASFDKVNSLDLKVQKGRWITVNGKHKFIEDKKKK